MSSLVAGPKPPPNTRPSLSQLHTRHFGRRDFDRLDQEAARGSHLCIGTRTIGKVQVQCKFHWTKAQWGLLGTHPAGIVYIDIGFKHPVGHSLSNANVLITLSEERHFEVPKRRFRRKKTPQASLNSENSLQITTFYGPKFINGPKSFSTEVSEVAVQPSVAFAGMAEVGGVGKTQTLTKELVDSWTFKGEVQPTKNGDGLRTLEWEFRENSTEKTPLHHPKFHTAFAFEHSGNPVIMSVEVEGRLKSKLRRAAHQSFKFFSKSKEGDRSMLTRIDLSSASTDYQMSLDGAAGNLNQHMHQQNSDTTSVDIFDSHQPHPEERKTPLAATDYAPTDAVNHDIEATQLPYSDSDELVQFLAPSARVQGPLRARQHDDEHASVSSERTLLDPDRVESRYTASQETLPTNFIWRFRELMAVALGWLLVLLTEKQQGKTNPYAAQKIDDLQRELNRRSFLESPPPPRRNLPYLSSPAVPYESSS